MSNAEEIQTLVLQMLDKFGRIQDTRQLSHEHYTERIDQLVVAGVLRSLASYKMITYHQHEEEEWIPTKEGMAVIQFGSHEFRVWKAIPLHGLQVSELNKLLENDIAKLGQNVAFRNKWIEVSSDGRLTRKVENLLDQTQLQLMMIQDTKTHSDIDVLKELKRRKLAEPIKRICFSVEKGPKFSLTLEKPETELTSAMLLSGEWKEKTFKPYNFDAAGLDLSSGCFHPLLKVREEFRQIFFEMGFTEMPTNRYVESSFWNFDALFQPQQHPAREAHDTFFLKTPAISASLPKDYVERVSRMHSEGGYESLGYRYDWSIDEARKNILRTHTTAVSARMLYALAQQPTFSPAKYFSIDKVFRNETVDATHLAEFHQIEGLIADYNLTLGDLIGTLNAFFQKLGIKRLRFKPAYNPYTEPSMEVFSFHEGLGKWIEIGNSGVFRPEMLRPMGFDPNVTVIAWGLSLERPTMIKYGISNIRDLVGHKVDLAMIRSNPICRLDKLTI